MSNRLQKLIIFETPFSQYTASSIIGEGGSGRVYAAIDEARQEYAIKVLDPNKATREKTKRFKNELRFCSNNKHPNILTVLDYGTHYSGKKSTPFYVMPLYPQSLRDLMSVRIGVDKAPGFICCYCDNSDCIIAFCSKVRYNRNQIIELATEHKSG